MATTTFTAGQLVYIEGLQSQPHYNGQLARVLGSRAQAQPSAASTPAESAEEARVPVELDGGKRDRLRVKPRNLRAAYTPAPFAEFALGNVATALRALLERAPAGALACVHYFRAGVTDFGAPELFQGAFEFSAADGCPTMDEAVLCKATSGHASLHVKLLGIEDAIEVVLLAAPAADHAAGGEQRWLDVGVPRSMWRAPVEAEPRRAALDADNAEARAFRSAAEAAFAGQTPGPSVSPLQLVYQRAMAVLVSGCCCPNKQHVRPAGGVAV